MAIYNYANETSDHGLIETWVQEILSELSKGNMTVFVEIIPISDVWIMIIWAQRTSEQTRCIGAIGYTKLYNARGTSKHIMANTIEVVASRLHDTAFGYITVPVFNVHDGTFESQLYNVAGKIATFYREERQGTIEKEAVQDEVRRALADNMLVLVPTGSTAQLHAASTAQATGASR
jgi:hypothetical protein